MELEIKHIAPYLPYGLNVLHIQYISFGKSVERIDVLNGVSNDCCTFNIGCDWYFDTKENDCTIKPILLPLESLRNYSNEIKALGYRTDENNFYNLMSDIPNGVGCYDIMQLCFEKHIDVFGLIPSGLAIDKTTLNINQ